MLSAVVFLVVCLASAALSATTADPVPVKVTPTSSVIHEGDQIAITFSLTQPIICNGTVAELCSVLILITNTRPDELALSACHVMWYQNEWQQERIIYVTGVQDFVDDGEKNMTLITEAASSSSEFYNGYNAPDISIQTKSRPTAQCASHTDPQYNLFDGGNFLWTGAGTVLMWAADYRDFEVHTRVTQGLNCGVAIRDGCDVIIFDLCSGSFVLRTSLKTNGPRINKLDGGTSYTVDFPSGASLKINVRVRITSKGYPVCGWSGCHIAYTYTKIQWLDVYATAPGTDFGVEDSTATNPKPRTRGICGSFDNNRNNDALSVTNFMIPNGKSLFDSTYTCTPKTPKPTNYAYCKFTPLPIQKPTIKFVDAEDITDLIKIIVVPDDDPRKNYVFEPDPLPAIAPTNTSGLNIPQLCKTAVEQSTAATICLAAGVNVTKYIQSCIADLTAQGNQGLIDGSIDSMKEECQFLAAKNLAFYNVTSNGTLIPNEAQIAITNLVCPNDCSFHGNCVAGVCNCTFPFMSADCSIDSTRLPVIHSIQPYVCDDRDPAGCPTQLTLDTELLLDSKNLSCKIGGVKVPAKFIGTYQAFCPFPLSVNHSGVVESVFNVTISNDDHDYSLSVPFIYYDSKCRVCERNGTCRLAANTCAIDGVCYTEGETSAENPCLACVSSKSTSAFSYIYSPINVCGPKFDNVFLKSLPEDSLVGTSLGSVFASNSYVKADPNFKITYSILNSTYFTINSTSGAVTSLSTFDFETKNAYSIAVQAADQSGNKVSQSFAIQIFDVDEPPKFTDASYSVSVDENLPAKALITPRFSDPDTEVTFGWARLTFTLEGFKVASQAPLFTVDSSTGVISTTTSLDFERSSNYSFVLRVTDGGGMSATVPVTVKVNDVNEVPTFIGLSAYQIPENSPAGTPIGSFSTEDPDKGQSFTYTLVDSANGLVTLTPAGALSSAKVMNYENKPSTFKIVVRSTDNGTPSKSLELDFEIQIMDENDKPSAVKVVTLSQATSGENGTAPPGATVYVPLTSIPEDYVVGTIVAQLQTVDEDDSQFYEYFLVDDSNGHFQVSGDSLILKSALDYETSTTETIKIYSTDSGSPALSTPTMTFTFNVTNVPDAPRDIVLINRIDLPENIAVNTVIGTIVGMDQDPNQNMVFSLGSNSDASKFKVGTTSCSQLPNGAGTKCNASLILIGALNFEAVSLEHVTIVAKSIDGLVGTGMIQLPILDVNDPVSGIHITSNSIVESSPAGTIVGALTAIDEDIGQTHTFTLTNDANGAFELQVESARRDAEAVVSLVVKDSSKLDYETAPSLTVTINVGDNGVPPTTKSFSLTLSVTDRPISISLPTPEVNENAASGVLVSDIVIDGLDVPATPNYAVTGSSLFAVAGSKLVVAPNAKIDYETAKTITISISITYTASQAGVQLPPASSQTFTIAVNDVNEPPTISLPGVLPVEIDDDSVPNTVIYNILASDPEMDHLTLSISKGNPKNIFGLSASGQLSVVAPPSIMKIEVNKIFSLTIVASDGEHEVTIPLPIVVRDDCYQIPADASNPNKTFCYIGGGTCVDGVQAHTCVCKKGYTGVRCEPDVTFKGENGKDASTSSSADSTGIIAGAVVGAILFIVLLLIVLLVVQRRRKQNRLNNAALFGVTPVSFLDDGKGLTTAPSSSYYETQTPLRTAAPVAEGDVFVPGCSNPLYAWYHPEFSREDCVDLLQDRETGAFVVRDYQPTPGWHMLHIKTRDDIVDEKIKLSDGNYQVISPAVRGRHPTFSNVPELVKFYASTSQTQLPVSLSLDNPIYDNTALLHGRGAYDKAPIAFPRDENAPFVPIKNRDQSTISQIASNSDSTYLNQQEARQALGLNPHSYNNATYGVRQRSIDAEV